MSYSIFQYKDLLFNHFAERLGYFFAGLVIFVLSFLAIYAAGRLGILLLTKLADRLSDRHEFLQKSDFVFHIARLLKRMVALTALLISVILVEDSAGFRLVIYKVYRIGMIVLSTDAIVNAMDMIVLAFGRVRKGKSEAVNETVMGFLSKIVKFLVVIFAVLIVLSELGFDVNGIIAGLGLGGVTFALAAKDTATNMFGGVNIIVDKPFVVGDWIETSTVEGVVEDISFRSTRIRTFFDSVIVVPNSTLSNDSITNWSKMNRRKDSFTFGLSYDTDKVFVRMVLNRVESVIKSHENVIDDTVIVRLNGFGSSGFEIYVVYFIDLLGFADFKRIREEVSFGIFEVLDDEGVKFAFPSHRIYMQKEQ